MRLRLFLGLLTLLVAADGMDPELLERAASGSKELGGDGVEPARYPTYQWDAVWADGDFFKYGFRGQGLYISPTRDLVVAFFGRRANRKCATRGPWRGRAPSRTECIWHRSTSDA